MSKNEFNKGAKDISSWKKSDAVRALRKLLQTETIETISKNLLGVEAHTLDAETIEALKLAQAAQRTYALAGATNRMLTQRATSIIKHQADNTRIKLFRPTTHTLDHLITADDSKDLKEAQATFVAAQLLFNREAEYQNKVIKGEEASAPAETGYTGALAGFKLAAVEYFVHAAKILEQKGFTQAAAEIHALEVLAERHQHRDSAITPHYFVYKLAFSGGTEERVALLEKLCDLTEGQEETSHGINQRRSGQRPPAP